jgi:hypothetical protein
MENYSEFTKRTMKQLTENQKKATGPYASFMAQTFTTRDMVNILAQDVYAHLQQHKNKQQEFYLNNINKYIDPNGIVSKASAHIDAWEYMKDTVKNSIDIHGTDDVFKQIDLAVRRKLMNELNEELKTLNRTIKQEG